MNNKEIANALRVAINYIRRGSPLKADQKLEPLYEYFADLASVNGKKTRTINQDKD